MEISFDLENRQKEFPPHRTISRVEDLFRLPMTRRAFEKAMIVVNTAFEVAHTAMESYWIYLGKDTIEDILVPTQAISHAYVEVSPHAILSLRDPIQTQCETHGYSVLGWGHSHADFGVFFSGTDWRNQERVFHETSNYALCGTKRIKYAYGTTFNVNMHQFAQITFQTEDHPIEHKQIQIDIIPEPILSKPERKEFQKDIRDNFKAS